MIIGRCPIGSFKAAQGQDDLRKIPANPGETDLIGPLVLYKGIMYLEPIHNNVLNYSKSCLIINFCQAPLEY